MHVSFFLCTFVNTASITENYNTLETITLYEISMSYPVAVTYKGTFTLHVVVRLSFVSFSSAVAPTAITGCL